MPCSRIRSRLFSPSGELVGAVNMLVDVSDLKRTRRALAGTRDVLAAQVHTLTRLHALSMFLGSGFDLRIGLQAVVDTFAELHGADNGLLTLYDEASGLLFPAASRGFASETLLVLGQIGPGLPANVVGRAFTTGQRAVVEDVEADLDFAAARPIARLAGFRAVHSVPILRRVGRHDWGALRLLRGASPANRRRAPDRRYLRAPRRRRRRGRAKPPGPPGKRRALPAHGGPCPGVDLGHGDRRL